MGKRHSEDLIRRRLLARSRVDEGTPVARSALRDRLAGVALNGLLSSHHLKEEHFDQKDWRGWLAGEAYQLADAMLEAREK